MAADSRIAIGIAHVRWKRQYIGWAVFATVGAVPASDLRIGDETDGDGRRRKAKSAASAGEEAIEVRERNANGALLIEDHEEEVKEVEEVEEVEEKTSSRLADSAQGKRAAEMRKRMGIPRRKHRSRKTRFCGIDAIIRTELRRPGFWNRRLQRMSGWNRTASWGARRRL